ncbi:MAG TPA: hypothetical protein VLT87_11265 [Thermoanaerobaculia bacterium]|nr:hypothetical protein [Thermoanaerobaculia bacterium]
MNAKTYLETVSRDVLEGLYRILADGRYTGEADEKVAAHLTTQARVSGHLQLTISGPTLGKHRSSIGLVSHRSPRLGPTSIDPGAPPQAPAAVELQPELAGLADAQSHALLIDLVKTTHQIKGILAKALGELERDVAEWKRFREEQRSLLEVREERPELRVVGGAER